MNADKYLASKKAYMLLKTQYAYSQNERLTFTDTNSIVDYYACSSHNTYIEEYKPKHASSCDKSNILSKLSCEAKKSAEVVTARAKSHQIIGNASSNQYLEVLKEGCRHVELDVYNQNKDEPIITHGGTYVNKIGLKSVINSILSFAEESKKKEFYPIILNIENNCSDSGCSIVSSYLKNMYESNKNYMPELCDCENKTSYSLKTYKNKILIRDSESKHAKKEDATYPNEDNDLDNDSYETDSDTKSIISVESVDLPDESKHEHTNVSMKKLGKKFNIFCKNGQSNQTNNLCGCYTKSINYSNLVSKLKIKLIKDGKLDNKLKDTIKCFIDKTKLVTTRSYPPGLNFASANYDPIICLSLGINYPALNFQTNDRYKAIYMAFFSNSVGYIKKPKHLLSETKLEDNVFNTKEYKYRLTFDKSDSDKIKVSLYTGFLTHAKNESIRDKLLDSKLLVVKLNELEHDLSVLYIHNIGDEKYHACLPFSQIEIGKSTTVKLRLLKNTPTILDSDVDLDKINLNKENAIPKVSDEFKYYYAKHIADFENYLTVTIKYTQ